MTAILTQLAGQPVRESAHGTPEVARHEFMLPYEPGVFAERSLRSLTLALLAAVICRHTGLTELLVSCRDRSGAGREDGTILRVDLSDTPVLTDLVYRLEAALCTLGNDQTKATPPSEEDAGRPVVRVRHGFGCAVGAGDLSPLAFEQQTQPLELDVQFSLADGRLVGTMTYDKRYLEPAYVRRLAGHIQTAFADAAVTPDRSVSMLNLISDAERQQLLTWGGSGVPGEAPRCIHTLVEEQVRLTPNAIALSCQGEKMTYLELDKRAEALANWLVETGVGPDRVVAVYSHRCMELYVALLAILKAGGCYLAIHPNTPAARIQYMLEDAAPVMCLTQADLRSDIPETPVPIVDLNDCHVVAQGARPRGSVVVEPEHLAYISYTSGSTGVPKGVCVPHRAVARLVRKPDWIELRQDDVFLQISPVAFDASTLEVWGPLTNGGRMAIYAPGAVTPDELAQVLEREGVTTLWLTSGLFHLMVDTQLEAFAGLRHVLAGGDSVSRVHLQRLFEAHPHLTFTNGYGPTENTTFTACWTTTRPAASGAVPIGHPISGTRVAILDESLELVPIGVTGELYAGGVGLARCYLNKPDVTAEKFIPAPRPTKSGERLYRTGDLARWREDGTIEFLGRADFQVKIQGFRVELGDIEAALASHPKVRNAVVVTQSGALGQKRLVAYIVPDEVEPDSARLIRAVKEYLQHKLPPYMIPWAMMTLKEIPLTKNGKVDRAALPAATRSPRSLESDYTPPGNDEEIFLAELWGRMLGVEPVGIDDDFFELGGHSLMAAELARQIQQGLGVTVPARTLYLEPTIGGLTAVIQEVRQRAASSANGSEGGCKE